MSVSVSGVRHSPFGQSRRQFLRRPAPEDPKRESGHRVTFGMGFTEVLDFAASEASLRAGGELVAPLPPTTTRRWRHWQTQPTENRPPGRDCGFESRPPHFSSNSWGRAGADRGPIKLPVAGSRPAVSTCSSSVYPKPGRPVLLGRSIAAAVLGPSYSCL
jgi:hypothetical protein